MATELVAGILRTPLAPGPIKGARIYTEGKSLRAEAALF